MSSAQPAHVFKVGKAPTKEVKYRGPSPTDYLAGGQQQTKQPLTDTHISTNLNTVSGARQPSTDRHVHFADNLDMTERVELPPTQMLASGVSMGV